MLLKDRSLPEESMALLLLFLLPLSVAALAEGAPFRFFSFLVCLNLCLYTCKPIWDFMLLMLYWDFWCLILSISFVNIVSVALLRSVRRRCWASLWYDNMLENNLRLLPSIMRLCMCGVFGFGFYPISSTLSTGKVWIFLRWWVGCFGTLRRKMQSFIIYKVLIFV